MSALTGPRSMRTRFAVAGSLALATVVATACGGGSSTANGSDAVTIKVWTPASPGTTIEQAYLNSWAKTTKDHIKIEFTVLPAAKLQSQLPLSLRTGGGPDVTSPSNIGGLVDAGFLTPLDGKLSSDTAAAYSKVTTAPSTARYQGKLYAIPTTGVVVRLAYNKDLFKKAGLDPDSPPTTYSEVIADAKAITQKNKGAYGFAIPLKDNSFVNQALEPSIIGGSEGLTIRGLFDANTKKFEPANYKPGIEMLRTLLADKSAYPGATSLDNEQELTAFSAGKIGMMFSATSDQPVLDGQLKSNIDWAAAPLPVPDGDTLKQALVRTGGSWAVNAKSPHQQAALEVLQALTSTDLQKKLAEAGLNYPLSAELADQKFTPKNSPHYSQYQADLSNPLDQAALPSPVDLLTIQGDGWKETTVKLIETKDSIDPALSSLSTKLNSALDAAVKSGKINLSEYGLRK